jgi:hypothetical protein
METKLLTTNNKHLFINCNFKIYQIKSKYNDTLSINNDIINVTPDIPILLYNKFYKSLNIFSTYNNIFLEVTFIKANKRKYIDVVESDLNSSNYTCNIHDNDINICQIYECSGDIL